MHIDQPGGTKQQSKYAGVGTVAKFHPLSRGRYDNDKWRQPCRNFKQEVDPKSHKG